MGNSAFGKGHHLGKAEGIALGLAEGIAQGLAEGKKGRAIVGGVSFVGGLAVAGAVLGYREFKARSIAKREQELPAEGSAPATVDGAGDEREAGEGITGR
ncbi:hypothetical protein [Micromonospora carbonacea]|uniref:Uncharacterized protein n=1 Tax=Micromonospora carbonacea TaxID=47853 RepID=A0A1C5AMR9_9ACTN|nr:hypothetical protein [Micromonospora carbonacea]SCF46381.1 hypothetical protein GA0070563_114178 [Micromonospora carbonacea]